MMPTTPRGIFSQNTYNVFISFPCPDRSSVVKTANIATHPSPSRILNNHPSHKRPNREPNRPDTQQHGDVITPIPQWHEVRHDDVRRHVEPSTSHAHDGAARDEHDLLVGRAGDAAAQGVGGEDEDEDGLAAEEVAHLAE